QISVTATVTPPVTDPVIVQQKPEPAPVPVIHLESLQEIRQLSIFDLFENTGEPAVVGVKVKKSTAPKRKTKKKNKRTANRQTNLFSGAMQQPYTPPKSNGTANGTTQINGTKQEAVGDLFSQANGNGQTENQAISGTIINTIPKPAPYSGELQPFHRNDCLAVDNGWVGHLQDVEAADGKAVFHPLQLPPLQIG